MGGFAGHLGPGWTELGMEGSRERRRMNRPVARQPVDDSATSWVGPAGFMKLDVDSGPQGFITNVRSSTWRRGELMNV